MIWWNSNSQGPNPSFRTRGCHQGRRLEPPATTPRRHLASATDPALTGVWSEPGGSRCSCSLCLPLSLWLGVGTRPGWGTTGRASPTAGDPTGVSLAHSRCACVCRQGGLKTPPFPASVRPPRKTGACPFEFFFFFFSRFFFQNRRGSAPLKLFFSFPFFFFFFSFLFFFLATVTELKQNFNELKSEA